MRVCVCVDGAVGGKVFGESKGHESTLILVLYRLFIFVLFCLFLLILYFFIQFLVRWKISDKSCEY